MGTVEALRISADHFRGMKPSHPLLQDLMDHFVADLEAEAVRLEAEAQDLHAREVGAAIRQYWSTVADWTTESLGRFAIDQVKRR